MSNSIISLEAKKNCNVTNVALFGSADIDRHHPLYQQVFQVAKYLAQQGKVIVNGGGPGTMDAATKGAQSANGRTLAVTFYPADMPEFEGKFNDNKVDKEIKTTNYAERLMGLIDNSDLVICFRGGTGTISEWSTAWLFSHLHYGNHKPIILYGEFWYEVMDVIIKNFFIGDKEQKVYKIVTNERELKQALDEFEVELENRCKLSQTIDN